MTTSMDELTKRFDGFEAVMTKMLDKLSGLEEWRSTADATMAKLLSSTTNTAPPPHHSEQAPPSSSRPPLLPVRPTTAPPHLSAHNFNPFDLNLAPPQDMRPSASSSERPSGHHVDHHHRDVGCGILGSHPPHPITGMFPEPPPHRLDHHSVGRSPPLPKLDFPKFDGENPRLWRDRCEMYFDVYGVSESSKTRFAALNFSVTAASWLHSVECKGRVSDWDQFCTLVCDRFDRHQYQTHMNQFGALK